MTKTALRAACRGHIGVVPVLRQVCAALFLLCATSANAADNVVKNAERAFNICITAALNGNDLTLPTFDALAKFEQIDLAAGPVEVALKDHYKCRVVLPAQSYDEKVFSQRVASFAEGQTAYGAQRCWAEKDTGEIGRAVTCQFDDVIHSDGLRYVFWTTASVLNAGWAGFAISPITVIDAQGRETSFRGTSK